VLPDRHDHGNLHSYGYVRQHVVLPVHCDRNRDRPDQPQSGEAMDRT
jgi:hypothetical protein